MFALTETWCHFNIDLNLANFGMYQSPAVKSSDKGRGSGGIILGINKQLQPQIDNVEIETSWIAVTLNPSLDNDSPAICVIFVYLPPNDTHATKLGRLFHLMENKIYNGFEIILVGDLNVRIGNLGGYHNLIDTSNLFSTTRNSCDLTKSAKAEIFIDFLDKNHLTIINGRSINDKSGKFTFISGRGSSVLDLAIVSPAVLEHIADFEIGCMPYSDHLPIILKFIGPNNKTENCYMEPKAKIKFSWSVDKIPTYIETLKELTPEHLADSTIDTQAEDFTGLIQTAMLRSGTRMEAKTKNIKSKPWFDKDCYLAKKEMKQNLKLYVKHNISADKIAYLSSKKKYSAILKLKKREYTDKIQVILSNVKDPSQFWKTINSLKYRNNLQGEISTADWQVFYRELLGSNLTKVVQLPLEILDIDPELDCEISLTEVTKEISKLGKNKATGLDEIPNEAIKYLLEEHTIYLRNLFNKILGTSQVPQQWTKTIIHPIFKNGDPDNPSNYRGISLISNLSKLFTSILKTRLNDWMERKSILAENQAGFRKGYSCQDHIFTLLSLIQMTLSRRRGKLYAFFIDLRKAFDTVPHHLLWKKLALNGLSCRFIKLIKNYYTQMTATVRWRGSFTEAIKIQAGVLQGEPLSPYLFILFLNDLVHLFDESELPGINLENYGTIHLLLYADDIVILGESKINLQLKINLLKKYLEENCLTLNQNKSKIMVFRNGGRTARSETWFWGQQPLKIVAKYTYLGYPLTTKISTQYASQYFRNKALNAINALWRILTKARIKSFTSVMKLLDTIVLPTLLYAAPMWAINQLKTAKNTQDTFLRRLLDLPNFTPGYVLRRECGRISTELNAVKLTLKFWVRILKMETSRLPHACLNYLWKVTAKKEIENSFTQNLIKILDSKGYSFLKGCEDYLAIQKELPGIIRTTTDQLIQNDQMKITDSTHFAHYKFLSESFMTEEYLRLNISLPNKRLVAQHRVLWQFFRQERKDFWKENGRNCLLCKDLMDDNLVHYFFQCPLLTEKRTETFPSPTSGQFRYHSICQLLSSDLNDKLLIDKYFKFCTEAGRLRKNAGQRILEDDPSANRYNPPNGYTEENRTPTTLRDWTTNPALERALVTIAHQDNWENPATILESHCPKMTRLKSGNQRLLFSWEDRTGACPSCSVPVMCSIRFPFLQALGFDGTEEVSFDDGTEVNCTKCVFQVNLDLQVWASELFKTELQNENLTMANPESNAEVRLDAFNFALLRNKRRQERIQKSQVYVSKWLLAFMSVITLPLPVPSPDEKGGGVAVTSLLKNLGSAGPADSTLPYPALVKVIDYVIEGWPICKKDVDEDAKIFFDFRHRLYLWNDLLCIGSAIVIPKTQRNAMLNLLHQSHQGISAIQGLARESLFWPRMSIDIAEKVKNCEICQKHQKSKIRQPLKPFPVPDYPWQTVSLDIFYIQKKPHLLVVDRYSGYPEVFTLDPPTAINVKNKLRETFARFGIPETMMSDNGPPFRSEIMTDFCIRWGIKQLFSSPHLHRSNGLAERNIQTIKNQLIKCRDEGSDPYLAILAYRNTPKNDLPSPAQLCLSRSLRCQIPRITPLYRPYQTNWRSIENAKRKRQSSMKEQYDRNSKSYPKVNVGEDAWCQIHPRETWTPVKISAQADSPQSFEVVTPSGNRLIRNQQFIRPRDGGYEKSQLSSEPITASPEAQHPQCYSPTMGESSTAPIQRSSEETNIDQREGATTSAGIAPEPSGRPRFSRFGRELRKPQRFGF
ncbi:hypothetical protein LAZ67_17000525 [Cordylochernes scorpioides]|uniref:RNA-directed DNA polymerase n=1 Tax=Cordylochernes scorpioides TaxID=51811 RepID=A0ABY6LCS6_9ARAC|nr:hypothetical protein LAZ67_17000525 [Cordylochernes scorpioides]